MRSGILNESTHCPAEKAVLLASFGVQAKYGNYEKEVRKRGVRFVRISYFALKVHTKGYLNSDNLLPPVVVNDHKLSREEWEEKIAKFHAKHNGMSRAEAMMEYLKVFVHLYFANFK